MQNLLFDEAPAPVEPSPAQLQKQAKKREVDKLRQRRCRERHRTKKSVTLRPQHVTPFSVSRDEPNLSRSPEVVTPEVRLLLDAFGQLSEEGVAFNRPSLLRALDDQAQGAGLDIFNAKGFLESAFERGALPRFEGTDWVSIPREVLQMLLES